MSQMKPNKTLVSPIQFQGFMKLNNTPSNRPERTGEGIAKEPGDHRGRISAELSNHPKKIGFNTFSMGLQSLGIHPNKENLGKIAGLIDTDKDKFHDLVSTARKNAFGQKQRVAEKKKGFQAKPDGSHKRPK
jgi:hypothetical protein